MLNLDVERMPYALCLIMLGILVDESTRVDIPWFNVLASSA